MKQLLLIRHGQASFGAADYDALSEVGHEQSRVLGRALARRGVRPDLIIRGGMRRHTQTVAGLIEGLALDQNTTPAVVEDAGWDEFDFQHVVEVHKPQYRDRHVMAAELAATQDPRRAFQHVFEEATAAWSAEPEGARSSYHESFAAFVARVQSALERAAHQDPARGTALVVSSGGPIALVAAHLLTGGTTSWDALNRVAVNTAVTKVLHGARGLSLSTFNSHEHLEHEPALLTYR